jgi:hypothetical protein
MPDESIAAPTSDPLRAVADAIDAAVQAAREGGSRAVSAATDAAPAARELVSRAVYKTSYAVSFCAVFPIAAIARLIPRENAAVYGVIDGAHAAIDFANQMKSNSLRS